MKMENIDKHCYFCGTEENVRQSEDCPPKSLVGKLFRQKIMSCDKCNHDLGLLDNIAVNWLQATFGVGDMEKIKNIFKHQIHGDIPKLAIGVDENHNTHLLIHTSSYAMQAWLLKLALGLHVHIKGCSFKGIVSVMAADFPQLKNTNTDGCRKLMATLDIVPFQWSEIETVDNQSFSMRYSKDTSDNLIVKVGFYGVISAYFHYYSFLSKTHGNYIQQHGATLWETPYDSELVRQTVCNYLKDDEGITLAEVNNIEQGFENSHNKKLHFINLQALQLYADEKKVSVRELLKKQENN